MMIIAFLGIYLIRRGQLSSGGVQMAVDITSLLQTLPDMVRTLPFYLNLFQLMFYATLTFTLGGLIIRAFGGYIPYFMKILGRLVFGFLALVTGLGIAWIIPSLSEIYIFQVMQELFLDVAIGAAISACILFVTLKMASYHLYNVAFIRRRIEDLRNLEEKALKIQQTERAKRKTGLRHPVRMIGIAAMGIYIAFGLVGFYGFPSFMKEIGITEEDLGAFADQIDNLMGEYGGTIADIIRSPTSMQDCTKAVGIIDNNEALSSLQPYDNSTIRAMVEEFSGETVNEMYSVQLEGKLYILAITPNQGCVSSTRVVCMCKDLDEIEQLSSY
jgi:hypothetical protein